MALDRKQVISFSIADSGGEIKHYNATINYCKEKTPVVKARTRVGSLIWISCTDFV